MHELIIKNELTVRELESIIRNKTKKHHNELSSKKLENTTKQLKNIVPDTIKYKLTKTQLTFRFDNEVELNQIIELLKGDE